MSDGHDDKLRTPEHGLKPGEPDRLRDRGGFREDPAEQGLKNPPFIPFGEDSGEWTRGGGSDPNEKEPSGED